MKKMLFWVLLCAPSLLFCQSETKNQPIKTKIDVFKEGTGVPIEMTIEEIGKVKAIEIRLLRLKNLISGDKINGLSFLSYNAENILDADEIDGLVKSLTIMKDAVATPRSNYTLINYKSRTGIEIGAYFDFEKSPQFGTNGTKEKKWMYYLRFAPKNTQELLNQADFMALCGFMEAAKNKL